MSYRDVIILIPCHSLEDFPSDMEESSAAEVLQAFAACWHPQVLAEARQLPRWHRADEPPVPRSSMTVVIPTASEGWLPHEWAEQARLSGARVVHAVQERRQLCEQLVPPGVNLLWDEEHVQDCCALGTCWLLLELLSRQMRNFGNIDELRLQNRAVAAAQAIVASDSPTAQAHLQAAFELLLEARERFYPVECYLLDLCLISMETPLEPLSRWLREQRPCNLMLDGRTAEGWHHQESTLAGEIAEALKAGRACLILGGWLEQIASLVDLSGTLWNLERGMTASSRCLGEAPRVWGMRRFGLTPVLPQLLVRRGYQGAIHLVLDDGIYPDAEYTRMRWRGVDHTTIEACSRIPLAVDAAGSFLRFPQRMAESMDNDHVAGVIWARWPQGTSPWYEDLWRSQRYAPVLGRFVTFEQLFQVPSAPGRICDYQPREYFSAQLWQMVGLHQPDPISRFIRRLRWRRLWAQAHALHALWACTTGESIFHEQLAYWEDVLEVLAASEPGQDALLMLPGKPTGFKDPRDQPISEDAATNYPSTTSLRWEEVSVCMESELQGFIQRCAERWGQLVTHSHRSEAGFLVLNTCTFARRATLELEDLRTMPPLGKGIVAVDVAANDPKRHLITVELPPCGFVWIPAEREGGSAPLPTNSIEANPWVLANQRLEITMNDESGGIAQVRHPRKRENRFSQMIALRFPREKTYWIEEEGERRRIRTQYALTRCIGHEPAVQHGAFQQLVTRCVLLDPENQAELGRFRQTTTLYRYRPMVRIEIHFEELPRLERDPWNHYVALRLAWDDSAAVISQSHQDGVFTVPSSIERFESLEFVEIASGEERLTLVTHGCPFHRRSGPRMLDTLVLTAGETERDYCFEVVLDHPYPLEIARDLTTPPVVVRTASPPHGTATGWLFQLDQRGVMVERWLPLNVAPEGTTRTGCRLRLVETEGRTRRVLLRCCFRLRQAKLQAGADLQERELAVVEDGVWIEIQAYEIVEVELEW
ncbi:MAG: hypothetical protein KatS3mg114_0096 [Planctomycetaceae bacterium]|nr:MAG: hypothetical protein KatS3mg114_0096 [Planctomycetaceae bacterium]